MLDILVAAAFAALGLASIRARPIGPSVLMLATAACWVVGDVASGAVLWHRGPLLHLLVAYPRGRPRDRVESVAIVLGYLYAAGAAFGLTDQLTLLWAVGTTIVVARGYRRARGSGRRARRSPLAMTLVISGCLAIGSIARLAGHPLDHSVLVAYDVILIATALALTVDRRWGNWSGFAVTSLVVDLGDEEHPKSLRDNLADALGDPRLVVGFPAPDGLVVDESGDAIDLSARSRGRHVTPVHDQGEKLAVLVHEPRLLDDPTLLGSVTALVRIVVTNVRLQSRVLQTTEQIEQSRRRLLDVADTEREGLAVELRSGAQQRLGVVADLLAQEPSGADLRELCGKCRQDVADIARGIHPQKLTADGLSAALAELTLDSVVPVDLTVLAERFPPEVEVAAYYLCAEALTNIAKHAQASQAILSVVHARDSLQVRVSDNGRGGAALGQGSGLIGMADRLDALGGTLRVESKLGCGTTVLAEIPHVS